MLLQVVAVLNDLLWYDSFCQRKAEVQCHKQLKMLKSGYEGEANGLQLIKI